MLVVFSFLVIPGVIAFLFTNEPKHLLTIAWSSGVVASAIGLWASYVTDLPTGPMMVTVFGVSLLVAFAIRYGLGWPQAEAD